MAKNSENFMIRFLFLVLILAGSGFAQAVSPIKITTISALLTLRPGAYASVEVEGYLAVGDGGGGMFYWSATSTASPDSCMTFRPSSAPTRGRWLRKLTGPINVKQCGAYGDGGKVTNAIIDSASDTVRSASNPWTSGHVGAEIVLFGAGASGANLTTTIVQYIDAGRVRIATPASTGLGGGTALFGHDDRPEFVAALALGREVQYNHDCYWSSGISISSRVHLTGDGRRFIYQGGGGERIAVNAGADGSVFDRVNLGGAYANGGFIYAIGPVDKITIKNGKMYSGGIGVRATSTAANVSKYLEIINNEFSGCGNGVNINSFQYSKINFNRFGNESDGAMARAIVINHMEDSEIIGNVVEGNPTQTLQGILMRQERTLGHYTNRNVRILSNQVYGIDQEGISVDEAGPSGTINGCDYGETVVTAGTPNSVEISHPSPCGAFTTNQLNGYLIRILIDGDPGPGTSWEANGIYGHIISNTGDSIILRRNWTGTAPVAGTNRVAIYTPWSWRDGDTATAGAAGSLVSSGMNWDANQHQNYFVGIVAGTARGAYRKIARSTADSLIFEYPMTVPPDNTSIFTIFSAQTDIDISHNITKNTGNQGIILYGSNLKCKVTNNIVIDAQADETAPGADNDHRAAITSFTIQATKFGNLEVTPAWYNSIVGNTIRAYNITTISGRNGIQAGGFNPAGASGMYNGFVASVNSFGLRVSDNTVEGECDKGIVIRAVEGGVIHHNTVDGCRGDAFKEDTISRNNSIHGNVVTNANNKPAFQGLGSDASTWGAGSPEGVYTGNLGTRFSRTDGGANTSLYWKASGAGTNTGWVSAPGLDPNGKLALAGRLAQAKGSDVASANDITLGLGNLFTVTGGTTINRITTTDWQAGAEVTLHFASTPTVAHQGAATTGTLARINLSGSANFVATANSRLRLYYDGTDWWELGRTSP